jgi:uridylate kinase
MLKNNMTRKFVIKVGGSLLFDKTGIRTDKIKKFAEILKRTDNIAAIIVGGGLTARTFIKAARELQGGESLCDTFGIEVSRLNARLLITAMQNSAYPEPVKTLEEARTANLFNKIIVAGGFVPGQSTTSVTFQIAESLKATDILILTNVDGVFDKDPNKHPDAKKYDKITIDELETVILGEGGEKQAAAGEYRIFDAVSIQIFKRSEFTVRLMNGETENQLTQLLIDKDYESKIGTEILR